MKRLQHQRLWRVEITHTVLVVAYDQAEALEYGREAIVNLEGRQLEATAHPATSADDWPDAPPYGTDDTPEDDPTHGWTASDWLRASPEP